MDKKNIRFYLFVLFATLFIGICFSSSDFLAMPYRGIKDTLISVSQWFIVFIELYCFLFVLGVNRIIFALFFPLLTLISSLLAYFRLTMYAVLTPMILDAVLNNDMRTSVELITPTLVVIVILSFIISCVFSYYRFKRIHLSGKLILPICLFVAILLFLPQMRKFTRPILERIPFNVYYTGLKYYEEKQIVNEDRPDLTADAICKEDSLVVVLVIGESLRADHLPMNGYARNTMPLMSNEDIISFSSIFTKHTATVRSIPHLLTRADSTDYSKANKERSFISYFNTCDFYTVWLANQESLNSYVYFMNECDSLFYVNINKSDYSFGYWTDDDLLPLFDRSLDVSSAKKLILLHTIGSHWWYNSHYTDKFAYYKPTIKSKIISSCTQEEMINSYDNTIRFTDHFLSQIIAKLRDKNAVLIYQSDHGEALGEDGLWLHAAETPHTQNPACMVWMSPSYKESHLYAYEKAVINSKKRYRTDYLFHSILDAAGIETKYKDGSLSIFR